MSLYAIHQYENLHSTRLELARTQQWQYFSITGLILVFSEPKQGRESFIYIVTTMNYKLYSLSTIFRNENRGLETYF